MKRFVILAVAASLAAVFLMPAVASAEAVKVDVCHLNAIGEWQVNSLPENGRAVQAHLNHGDALPGDPVPDMAGHTFNNACVPVADEVIFAVAFTDTDTSDGGYNPNVDSLIAKLVDGNSDGVPNSGDKVITHQYPTNVAGTTFAAFNVTERMITGFSWNGSTSCTAFVGSDSYSWRLGSDFEQYSENRSPGGFTNFWDQITGTEANADSLSAHVGSPSLPSIAALDLEQDSTVWRGDQGFVDIELNCGT
jgi:hypothetical protein